MRHNLFVCLIAIAFPLVATAQDEKLPHLQELAPEPGSRFYPNDLASTGAQGAVLVRAITHADGSLSDAVVLQSSRSRQLDDMAVAIVEATTLKVHADKPLPPAIVAPVVFERDTVFTLPGKTCREFNVDLAYARSLSSDAGAGDVRAYTLGTGLLAFMPGIPLDKQMAVVKQQKVLPPKVEAACAAAPEALFMKTLSDLALQK